MFIEVWNSSLSASILGFGSVAIADKNPCYLLYIGDYTLPSYIGVIKSHYEKPCEPPGKMGHPSVAEDIEKLSCTSGAFCAVRGDGHVVTWMVLRSKPRLR